MSPEYVRQALRKIGSANTLVNIVSRRVRQLNEGGSQTSKPLIEDAPNYGFADIALREIIEDKLGWEPLEKGEAAELPERQEGDSFQVTEST